MEVEQGGSAGDEQILPVSTGEVQAAAEVRSEWLGRRESSSNKKEKKAKDGKGRRCSHRRSHRHHSTPTASSPSSSSSSDEDDSESGSDAERCYLHGPGGRRRPSWQQPGSRVTSSFRQLDTLSSTHQYTISGFELARSIGCGSRMCSDYFEVAGQYFRLEVYPSGYTVDLQKYISLYLTTPEPTASAILHEIAITDQSGKGKHISRSSKRRIEPMLARHGVVAAYPCFAKHKRLKQHARRYLLHDTLVIRATVDVVHSWRSVQKTAPPVAPHATYAPPPPSSGAPPPTFASPVPPPQPYSYAPAPMAMPPAAVGLPAGSPYGAQPRFAPSYVM